MGQIIPSRRTARTVSVAGAMLAVGLVSFAPAGLRAAQPAQTPAAAQLLGSASPGPISASVAPSVAPSLATLPLSPDFYTSAQPVSPGPLGEVLASVEVVAPEGLREWAVLYRSTGLDGAPTAVSGIVLAPAEPPTEPRPVLALAHGTTGLADQCAPSRTDAMEVNRTGVVFARAGWVVAATDYEGLGTPGPHPYIVGPSEGRSMLDAARAAGGIEGTGASRRVGLLGISQGGHATLWADQLAPAYAPELDVVGAVAAAPAGDLTAIVQWAAGPDASQVSWLNDLTWSAAWHQVYGLPLNGVLTPEAQALVPRLDSECMVQPSTDPLAGDPSAMPDWAAKLRENSPGSTRAAGPILYFQGTADDQIPVASAHVTLKDLCAAGDSVDYRELPGVDHGGSLQDGGRITGGLEWLDGRLAGEAATSSCAG